MYPVQNINSEPRQRNILEFSRGSIELIMIFIPTKQFWRIDVTYTRSGDDESQPTIYGVKLANGTTHFKHRNWPFDFAVVDTTGNGVDPFRIDDFETGRSVLYFVSPEEMIEIRGVDVQ